MDSEGNVRDKYLHDALDIVGNSGVTYTQVIPAKDTYMFLTSVISGYPTTFFLDQEGNILGNVAGAYNKDKWLSIIDSYRELAAAKGGNNG